MATPYQDRALPAPVIDASTQAFFEATAQGVLRIKRCTACSRLHWYPRALCPYCLGDTEWVDSAGRGSIYSVSVARKAGPTPYAIAYVALDEGVTLLSNIVDADLDSLHIGQRVKLCFKPAEDGAQIPMFTPE